MEEGERSYTVDYASVGGDEHIGGRYINRYPRDAAIKAAGRIFRESATPHSEMVITMRETTQGASHGVKTYEATKVALDGGFEAGGKNIPVKQIVKVRRMW